MNIKDGAVDNWGGHWQRDAPKNPDFTILKQRWKEKREVDKPAPVVVTVEDTSR